MEKEEQILSDLFRSDLENIPTFSDEMIQKMREEVQKAKLEAENYKKTAKN